MNTKIEQLREIVTNSVNTNEHHCVKRMILENELTFIENRHMEDYFLVAHRLMSELNKNGDVLIGPGWDWMIGSHVCRSLGITHMNPCDLSITPIITWGKDNYRPTITIEVDKESYEFVSKIIVEYEDKSTLPINIQSSEVLSRIKKILALIKKNGKDIPKLYDKSIWNEDYQLFYHGFLNEIPLFNDKSIQRLTKMLISQRRYGIFDELLDIQGLTNSEVDYTLIGEDTIDRFQKKHGVLSIMGKNRFPWGFLFKEDAAWFLNGWVSLSWKQTAQVIEYADTKNEIEAEELKQIFICQGVNNGFKESELNRIWNSLFRRRTNETLPSKAHYAGRVYLSVFLARLKNEFPEEFNAIKE